MDMWYFASICVYARSWREFAKCCFAHFPSFFSVHVDIYADPNQRGIINYGIYWAAKLPRHFIVKKWSFWLTKVSCIQ